MASWTPTVVSPVADADRVTLGHPLVDDYLAVVRARWRRNTLWATAYDLKVFLTVVGKDPVEVTVADVLGFIRTQRGTGEGKVVRLADRDGGLALSTVRRRLSLRYEHAAWLERTVQLGDDHELPSTNMLGMLSNWMDMQGNGDEARRLAQRGLDVAPAPHHPDTANCWWDLAGASPSVPSGSPEALAAFQHQTAAVANTPDLNRNWWALVCLVDASLNADRGATPALQQQLSEIAARVQCPRLTVMAHEYEGHAYLCASPPDFDAAITSYGHVAEIAHATGDRQSLGIAQRCLAMASTGLGAPDALARCHDALETLFENRHWQKIWQTLESVTLALARASHMEQAAVILGELDAHSPGFGLEHGLHFRATARELVEAHGLHNAAKFHSARTSADELVANAMAYCSAD